MPDNTVAIRFNVSAGPYNAGEIAGFPPKVADKYLSSSFLDGEEMRPVAEKATDEDMAELAKRASRQIKKVPIQFRIGYRGYNAGEIAGFDPDEANRILDMYVMMDGKRHPVAARAGSFLERIGVKKGPPPIKPPEPTPIGGDLSPNDYSDAKLEGSDVDGSDKPEPKKKRRGRPPKNSD